MKWPTRMYIDGRWAPAGSGKTLPVVNPANGERLADVALADAADVDRAVRAARKAFDQGPWPQLDPLERGRFLFRIAEAIRARLDDFAMTDTLNIGKLIRDPKGWDTPVAAELFESYGGLADKIAGKCFGTLPDNVTMQFREPLGVVASIVPWNFPLTNAAIKIAPTLACGNCVVFKPSELAPLTAFMLAQVADEDEADGSRKHTEFIATHKPTKQIVAVEAKSRHRPGVLGHSGEERTGSRVPAGIHRLLRSALNKPSQYPLVVFVDLNLPPSGGSLTEQPWFKEVMDTVAKLGNKHGQHDPFSLIVFSNYPDHYGDDDSPAPVGNFFSACGRNPEKSVDHPDALAAIHNAVNKHGVIPNTFEEAG